MYMHVSKYKSFIKYVSSKPDFRGCSFFPRHIFHNFSIFCFSCKKLSMACLTFHTSCSKWNPETALLTCVVVPIAINKHGAKQLSWYHNQLFPINKIKVIKTWKTHHFISFSLIRLTPLFHNLEFTRTVSQKYQNFINWSQLYYSSRKLK